MNADSALIADQARRIAALEALRADAKQRISKIRLALYRVGGPLNDNKLRYSPEQLEPFVNIAALSEGFDNG